MTKKFTIMFDDLDKDTQDRLLEFYDFDSPVEGNWDTSPLVVLELEDIVITFGGVTG